jgi:predicted enzyme related to lactoylglutathione lyase
LTEGTHEPLVGSGKGEPRELKMPIPAYINIDTQDPERITNFWCDLLGVKVLRTRDEGRYFILEPAPSLPGSMMLVFQRVPEPKVGKNRVHVDVEVDDLDEGTKRVEALGGHWGEPAETFEVDGFHWRVMADPEGNEFCIMTAPSP